MNGIARLTSGSLVLAALVACNRGAQVHGRVDKQGAGVPYAMVSMKCPDGALYRTTTNQTGDFRFEGLGPGVDDACTLEVDSAAYVPAQSIGTGCGTHDAKGACTDAVFAFEVPGP